MKFVGSSSYLAIFLAFQGILCLAVGVLSLTGATRSSEIVIETGQRVIASSPVECHPRLLEVQGLLQAVNETARLEGSLLTATGLLLVSLAVELALHKRRQPS